jgi:hypothetical protein
MEGGIAADAPLSYAEFQFFTTHNRYEVCACSGNTTETVSSGILERLLLNCPEVKKLHSKGFSSFRILPPANPGCADWFTKSILTRFLNIVGSPDILNVTNPIENEISQLEETRKFQLSLYVKAEAETSDASKNELLRAMDLRITALRDELVSAFNQAAGGSCSPKQIADLEIFSHYFGAINIRDFVRKFVQLCQQGQLVDFPSEDKFIFTTESRNDKKSNNKEENLSNTATPVKYGVSPAKAAQVERKNLSESEESSFSSEDDQPSVERSRTLIRPASPRRSASPMRRVQIGRSGSRRASALTIKSLNIFPARDRGLANRENSSEDEGSQQQPVKKTDVNVQRISVQAAISLFEGKQKDQNGDATTKTRSSLNGPSKSVLRRWSSGMGESSVSESSDTVTPTNLAAVENLQNSQEVKPNSEVNMEFNRDAESSEGDSKSDRSEKDDESADPVNETLKEENNNKVSASAEWGRQKEAELNQLLMKMMETKPSVNNRNKASDNSKSKTIASEQRGGFYDHYKQKRDEKLRGGEVAGKRAEQEAQFKAMQKFLDEKKAQMVKSTNKKDVTRRHSEVLQKPQKNSTQSPSFSKKETSKSAVVKKATPRSSSLPATRKSWPSTPSSRSTGVSPAKTPVGPTSTGTTPVRRKPQPASPVLRSNPKVEKPQPRTKAAKSSQTDTKPKNTSKTVAKPVSKPVRATKSNVQTASEDQDQSSIAKPSFYSKVTRKSSVVPLESKPFLRKGSGIGPGVGPVLVKKVALLQAEESSRKADPIIQDEENPKRRDVQVLIIETESESEDEPVIPPKISELSPNPNPDLNPDKPVETSEANVKVESKAEEEEEVLTISPSAWGEIEEYEEQPIPSEDSPKQIRAKNTVTSVGPASPRIRHSLSQMLLEESSEAEIMDWGNAENPPAANAMVFQKDAPKGLKRLLKFAGRKNKSDTNSNGWSSPSAFSEGEDDSDEVAKAIRRNADNLLKKAALNANNYGYQKTSLYEAYEKNSVQSNISKFTAQNPHKLQDDGASPTAAKAARSFFSLSAFRGNKPNETKLR